MTKLISKYAAIESRSETSKPLVVKRGILKEIDWCNASNKTSDGSSPYFTPDKARLRFVLIRFGALWPSKMRIGVIEMM